MQDVKFLINIHDNLINQFVIKILIRKQRLKNYFLNRDLIDE